MESQGVERGKNGRGGGGLNEKGPFGPIRIGQGKRRYGKPHDDKLKEKQRYDRCPGCLGKCLPQIDQNDSLPQQDLWVRSQETFLLIANT